MDLHQNAQGVGFRVRGKGFGTSQILGIEPPKSERL